MTTEKVIVNSDGKPWRPVIHVQDVARAFIMVLEAPLEKIHNQAFNNGANQLNHQIIELAEITAGPSELPARAEVESGADQRPIKLTSENSPGLFLNLSSNGRPSKGAAELYQAFQPIGLTTATSRIGASLGSNGSTICSKAVNSTLFALAQSAEEKTYAPRGERL